MESDNVETKVVLDSTEVGDVEMENRIKDLEDKIDEMENRFAALDRKLQILWNSVTGYDRVDD